MPAPIQAAAGFGRTYPTVSAARNAAAMEGAVYAREAPSYGFGAWSRDGVIAHSPVG